MPVEEFLIDGKPASELRVVDLKELLEKRGLSKSGSKQVLIGRLKESMLSEEKDESLSNIVENSMPENEGRVPNMEMKSCGSNIVAQYLEKQQQALLAAKKAAMQTRATDARHSSNSSSHEESSIVSSVNNGSEKVDTQPSFSPMKKSEKLVEDEKKSEGVIEEQQRTEYIDEDKSEVDKTILQEAIIVEEKDSPNTPQIPENATLKTTDEEMNEHKNHELEESGVVSILEKEEPLMSKEDIDQESQENSEAISNPSLLESKEIVEREDHNADVATSDSDRAGEVESGSERSIEEQMEEQSSDHGDAVPDAVTSSKDMECNDLPESVSTTEKPARKRRWGSTTVGKRATVSISSDSLKDIVGDVKTAEVAMLETQVEEQEEQLDYDDEPIPKRIVLPREEGEKEDVATQATEKAAATTTRTANDDSSAAIQRARKIKMDEPEVTELFGEECIRVRPASPARRPIDRIIHVHGLTRPFNYKSWLSFLSSFGKFDVQNDFWIDNIKSHCLVRYATTEEATTARQQLDNIKWPKFNSSVLRVEYAGEDDFNRFKKMKEENNVSNVRNVNGNGQPSDIQVIRQRQVREITTTNDKENDVRQIGRSPKREDQADNKLWPTNREWDRGKGEWKLGERSPPTTNTDRRERSSRRESPSSKRAEIKEKAAPAKLLEDLFRKTKTSPFIYWLPLTQEQVNDKQQQKLRRDRERSEERRRRPSPPADRRPRDDFGSRYDRQRRR